MTPYELARRDFNKAEHNLMRASCKPNVPAEEIAHLEELYILRKIILERIGEQE